MFQDLLLNHIEPSLALTVYILTIFIVMFISIWLYYVCRQCHLSTTEALERESRIFYQATRAPLLTSLPLDYNYGKYHYDKTYAESDVMEPQTLRKLINHVNPIRCVCAIFKRCFRCCSRCSCLGRDDSQGIDMNPKSMIGPNVMLKMEGDMLKYARVFHLLMEESHMDSRKFVHMESETEV